MRPPGQIIQRLTQPSFHYLLVAGVLLIQPPAVADSADADNVVTGRWANDQSILEITRQGESLSARIFALLQPNYLPDEEFGPVGAPRRDDNNPDETLRERPLRNLELLSEYAQKGKRWEGKIYDPETGNTYSSRMELDDEGNLKMRGFLGISLLGRTVVLEPLRNCTALMQDMLRNSSAFDAAPECREE
ncbi:MAG: DUF2147 domain-containing protein [Pseudomonadota bacterium]